MTVNEELQTQVDERFRDIKDLVFECSSDIISKMRLYISEHEQKSGRDCKEVKDMSKAFLALFEVTAQDYREKFGTKYQVETVAFIDRCLSNKSVFFNDKGMIVKYPNDTVVCMRLPSGTCIDFCFGLFDNIRLQIQSKYYIIFFRDDMTDLSLFELIFSLMQENNGFTNKVAKILLEKGVMYNG